MINRFEPNIYKIVKFKFAVLRFKAIRQLCSVAVKQSDGVTGFGFGLHLVLGEICFHFLLWEKIISVLAAKKLLR